MQSPAIAAGLPPPALACLRRSAKRRSQQRARAAGPRLAASPRQSWFLQFKSFRDYGSVENCGGLASGCARRLRPGCPSAGKGARRVGKRKGRAPRGRGQARMDKRAARSRGGTRPATPASCRRPLRVAPGAAAARFAALQCYDLMRLGRLLPGARRRRRRLCDQCEQQPARIREKTKSAGRRSRGFGWHGVLGPTRFRAPCRLNAKFRNIMRNEAAGKL